MAATGMSKSNWHRFTSTAELDQALAIYLAQRLTEDLARYGDASLAVSGGSTPTGMFRQLSRCNLDWSRVWLTLVDERCVPLDSPDSNERMLRDNLLQSRAASTRLVSMASTGEDDASALNAQISAMPRPFSAVVLGMGHDGHTASWFPGAANLEALLDPSGTAQVAMTEALTAPHRRTTLTLSAVLESREIIIHITGEKKKVVIEQAAEKRYPVAAVLEQRTTPASIWWAQ
jgi:6-phosphogluconolactonase